MERTTVPFRIATRIVDMTSQSSAKGLVRIEESSLVIEFRQTTVDMATMATEEGPVREVAIPVSDIESMETGRRWPWGSKLRIRVRRMSLLEDVPGSTGNEMAVRVRRRDHDRARSLCIATSLLLSGEEIRRLESDGGSDR